MKTLTPDSLIADLSIAVATIASQVAANEIDFANRNYGRFIALAQILEIPGVKMLALGKLLAKGIRESDVDQINEAIARLRRWGLYNDAEASVYYAAPAA